MSLKLHRFWTFCEWICFLFTSFSFSISSWSWNFTDSENSQVRMKMLVGYMHCRSGRELVLCGWNFPCTHCVSHQLLSKFLWIYWAAFGCWNFFTFEGFFCFASNPRKWLGYSWPCLQLGTDWKGGHKFFGKLFFPVDSSIPHLFSYNFKILVVRLKFWKNSILFLDHFTWVLSRGNEGEQVHIFLNWFDFFICIFLGLEYFFVKYYHIFQKN